MATSGSFATNMIGSFYFTISWWRTGYSSELNEHYISYSVTAHNSAGSYRTVYHRQLYINGNSVQNASAGTKYYDGNTVFTGSLTIPSYNDAGNTSIRLDFYSGVGTTSSDNCTGTNGGYEEIDQIPRKANITRCDNFYSDNDAYMEFSNPGGFSCNIRLEYGSNFGSRITRSVYTGYGGGYNFNLTNSEKGLLLAACPSSNTLAVRYVVATLVNGTETWWSYYDRTMTVSDYEPTFSNCTYADELSDSLTLTGNNQRIIKNYNNTKIIISTANKAVAVKGASMVKYRAVCGSVSDEQDYSSSSEVKLSLPNIENQSIDIYAIDSRGKSKKITKEISSSNWKNYSDPIILNAYIFRTNSAGTQTSLSINGTFWNSSFGSVNNDFTLFRYRYKKTTDSTYGSYNNITPTKSSNNYSFSANINGDKGSTGFDSSFSYNIQLDIKDKIREITYDLILGAGKPLMAFQREGVSFGAPYDTTVGGPLQVTGKLTNTGDVNVTGNLSYSGILYKGTENILQRHIITLGKTTDQSISPNVSPVSVQFTGVKYKIGSKLSFSSYGVMVGAGVNYVLVNGLAWVEANSGYKWLQLMLKRGNNYITLSSAITPKNTYEVWDSIALPSQLIRVEEGDYIYMTVAITGSGKGQVAAGTYGQQSTYMTVEVVE